MKRSQERHRKAHYQRDARSEPFLPYTLLGSEEMTLHPGSQGIELNEASFSGVPRSSIATHSLCTLPSPDVTQSHKCSDVHAASRNNAVSPASGGLDHHQLWQVLDPYNVPIEDSRHVKLHCAASMNSSASSLYVVFLTRKISLGVTAKRVGELSEGPRTGTPQGRTFVDSAQGFCGSGAITPTD